jgi:hypothetical protein
MVVGAVIVADMGADIGMGVVVIGMASMMIMSSIAWAGGHQWLREGCIEDRPQSPQCARLHLLSPEFR